MRSATMDDIAKQPDVRVGVGVMLLAPNGYVLMRRQGSHGEGEWSFPGGHLEFGETVLDCARRECGEELGVTLKDACTVPLFTEDFFPDHNRHYITVYVTGWCEEQPRIQEPEKCSQLRFVTLGDQLPQPTFSGVKEVWGYKTKSVVQV